MKRRKLGVEPLEIRRLLAVDWRNPVDSLDINDDQEISPLDALLIINELNTKGPRSLPGNKGASEPYIDASGDNFASPLDALIVVNAINQRVHRARMLAESGNQLAHEQTIAMTLGQSQGTRTLRLEIDAQLNGPSGSDLTGDLLNVYLVDPSSPTSTLLDRGVPGTSLFSLYSDHFELAPGLAVWDGRYLQIDVGALASSRTGIIKLQLLSGDGANNSHATVKALSNEVRPGGTAARLVARPDEPVLPAGVLNVASLTATPSISPQLHNVRFNSQTGTYEADVDVQNLGSVVGRAMAIAFDGLPAQVSLRNASGRTATGLPYINLHDAIPTGGLLALAQSQMVHVEIESTAGQAFVLKPMALVGGLNRPPQLSDPGELTISPGSFSQLQLSAIDPDGDALTYQISGGADSLAMQLSPDGTLQIFPKPGQLGTFALNVTASDGALADTKPLIVHVVADSLQTTRISGHVLDVDGSPLASVQVELGNQKGLTSSTGQFTLDAGAGPPVTDTLRIRGDLYSGNPNVHYPFIAEKLELLLSHPVYANVDNEIARPIYLPKLDVANGKPIDPTKNVTVTSANLPGASLLVRTGTLLNQQGSMFTGVLSLTEVPVDRTPAALPDNLLPDLVVTIQPGEMAFATPAPLSLPNRGGWPAGTVMDLWSINPVTGQFDDAGDMKVSANGQTIDTTAGGVRNSSWHFAAPRPVVLKPPASDVRTPDLSCNSCTASAELASDVELNSGSVFETYALSSYFSMGTEHALALRYDSLAADPRPIVHFGFDNVGGDSSQRLMARLVAIDGAGGVYPVAGKSSAGSGPALEDHYWSLPPAANQTADAALQLDLRSVPTGVIDYRLKAGIVRLVDQSTTGTLSEAAGQLIHVNTIDSAFGSGWSLSATQEIVPAPDGSALLIDGQGRQLLFKPKAGSPSEYLSPAGDFSKLVKDASGIFTRTEPDGAQSLFNASGKLSRTVDRNGNATTFEYVGGQLSKITDSAGLVTSLKYSGGRVSTIEDPAGRRTTLTYDDSGNLVQIQDPTGSIRSWQYDDKHHLTAAVDERQSRKEIKYDFAGRATSTRKSDGTIQYVQPVQTQGLLPADATIDPVNAPLAQSLGDAVATFTDGKGHVRSETLDRAGQSVESRDALGPSSKVVRDSANQILQARSGDGSSNYYTYDDRGNVLYHADDISTPQVLVLSSGRSSTDDAVAGALEEQGVHVVVGPEPQNWTGAQVDVTQFDAVLVLRSWNLYRGDMPTAGQDALVNFVENGGGLITTEWLTNQSCCNQFARLVPLLPAVSTGYSTVRPTTYERVSPDATLDRGLDSSFVITQGYADGTEGLLQAKPGAQVFYRSTNAQHGPTDGVVGWDFAEGRVLSLSLVITDVEPTDDDGRKLLGNSVFWVTHQLGGEQFEYDPKFNQVTRYVDSAGKQTLYEIDPSNGNVLSMTHVVGEVGGSDDVIERFTYTASGQLATRVDPLGHETVYGYDSQGNPAQITYAKSTSDQAIESFEYDRSTIAGRAGQVTRHVAASGAVTLYEYDPAGRLLRTIQPASGGGAAVQSLREYDAAGNLVRAVDELGRETLFSYDALGRLILTQGPDPDGAGPQQRPVTSLTYDAADNVVAETDALGLVTRYVRDERNRLIQTIAPDGATVTYAYDLSDNRTEITDSVGNVHHFVYDARNRLVEEDGIEYQYDMADHLIEKKTAAGRITRYTYDDLGSMVKETWVGGGNELLFTHDAAGNTTSIQDSNSSLTIAYDARDRTQRVDIQGSGSAPRVVLQYTYDAAGNVVSLADAINGQADALTQKVYDERNLLTKITRSGANVTPKQVEFHRNPAGQVLSIDRSAGSNPTLVSTEYAFDAAGRITRIETRAGGNPLSVETLAYDADNRVAGTGDGSTSTTYEYDAQSQLIASRLADNGTAKERFAYDANGNRVSSSVHGDGYQTGPNNELLSDGKYDYVYDLDGNLVTRTDRASGVVRSLAWDYRNRLVEVVDRDAGGNELLREKYTYDGFDRRISKLTSKPSGSSTTYYVYDDDNALLEFVDPDSQGPAQPALARRYLNGADVDQVLAQEDSSGATQWLLTDHLGSIRTVADASGAVLERIDYDAFGTPQSSLASSDVDRYFTARDYDAETGYYYFRARYYDAGTGRFLSRDPLGSESGDLNAYRYAENNVLTLNDPLGLQAEPIGPVKIRATGKVSVWERGYQPRRIQEGVIEHFPARIRTFPGQSASLIFPDGTLLRLNENSLLLFRSPDETEEDRLNEARLRNPYSGTGYFCTIEPRKPELLEDLYFKPQLRIPTVTPAVRG